MGGSSTQHPHGLPGSHLSEPMGRRWRSLCDRPLPRVACPTIVGLFLAVTGLRWYLDKSGEAVALLYVVPIALSGLWYGRRGGAVTAAIGGALFVVLAALHGRGDLDATGWTAPPVAMALVGGLVGELSERATRARGSATRHAERALRLRERCERQEAALARSDSFVQRVAAARWMLEVGCTDEAVQALTDAVTDGIAQLSEDPRPAAPR